MPGPTAIQTFINAASSPNEATIAALGDALAEDIFVRGPVTPGEGRDRLLEALAAPNAARFVNGATWSDPVESDGEFVSEARMAPGGALGGVRFAFRLDGAGNIARIEQELIAAAPPSPLALALGADLKALIDGALANGTPIVVTYVDAKGVPHISPRGSVQVLNDHQIGLWARDPNGGMLKGIAANPHLALYYRDPASRTAITMSGRATAAYDGPVRDTIYENQPAIERNFDGRKRGVAIVVDVDELETAGPSGRVKMVRQ